MSDDDQPDNDPEIERRIAAILDRFPDRFSPDQVDQIQERVGRSSGLGTTLRKTELENGIGPWFDPRAMTNE